MDWNWGLVLRLGIRDWDWGLGLGMGIGIQIGIQIENYIELEVYLTGRVYAGLVKKESQLNLTIFLTALT